MTKYSKYFIDESDTSASKYSKYFLDEPEGGREEFGSLLGVPGVRLKQQAPLVDAVLGLLGSPAEAIPQFPGGFQPAEQVSTKVAIPPFTPLVPPIMRGTTPEEFTAGPFGPPKLRAEVEETPQLPAILRAPQAGEMEDVYPSGQLPELKEPAPTPLFEGINKKIQTELATKGEDEAVNAIKDVVGFIYNIPGFIGSIGPAAMDILAQTRTPEETIKGVVEPIEEMGMETIVKPLADLAWLAYYQTNPLEYKGEEKKYEEKIEELRKSPAAPVLAAVIGKGVFKQLKGIPKGEFVAKLKETTGYLKTKVRPQEIPETAFPKAPQAAGVPEGILDQILGVEKPKPKPKKIVVGKEELALKKKLKVEGKGTFREFVEGKGYDWSEMKLSHPEWSKLKAEYGEAPKRVAVDKKPIPTLLKGGDVKLVQSLRHKADALQKQIDAKRSPAIADQIPTARRSRIAASMASDAEYLEKIQYSLRTIADAREAGTLPESLSGIRSRAEAETLLRYREIPSRTTEWMKPDYKRMAKAGIENQSKFKRAKKDLADLGEGLKKPPEEIRQKQIAEKRREIQFRKEKGFFVTPKTLAETMARRADIKTGESVLEPSAGLGNIADALPKEQTKVIEQSYERSEFLKLKDYEVVGDDFLQHTKKYDKIVMNPPFENLQDITHVRHAYESLKPGGKVVSIMGEAPFFRGDKKAVEFRSWLESVEGTSEKLPPGTFKEAGTGAAARLVEIEKPPELGKKGRKVRVTRKKEPVELGFLGTPEAVKALGESVVSGAKEISRLTSEMTEKMKTRPEIRTGVKESKEAMIEHDRSIRRAESTSKLFEKVIKDVVPDKGRQMEMVHAYEHKMKGPHWEKLTDLEQSMVEWVAKEKAKLNKFIEENEILDMMPESESINHIFHHWIDPKTGEPYKGMYGKFSKGLPQAKQRVIPTYESGIKKGLKPATTNIGKLVGLEWEAATRAHQSREMFKTLHNIGAEKGIEIQLMKGRALKPIRMVERWDLLGKQGLTEDYVRYSHPALDKAITFKDANGTLVRLKGAVGVRKELFPFVQAYLESPNYGTFSKLNFATKSLKLGFSMFHVMSLGMQELANFRVPFKNIPRGLREMKNLGPELRLLHQEGLELFKGYEDIGYRNKFFEGSQTWKKAGNFVTKPIEMMRTFIFDVVQPGMKASFALDKYNELLPKYLKKGLTKEQAARDVVKAADGHFSGEHYKRSLLETNRFMAKMYFSPAARKFWQGALLSPTWQREHLLVAKNVAKSFMPDRFIRKLGLSEIGPIKGEFRKYLLGATMLIGAVDLWNMYLTQKMDGEAKHLWQNPAGKGFAIRAPWNEPGYTTTDKAGKERRVKGGPGYIRPLKSVFEVAEWVKTPFKKFIYKLSPIVTATGRQMWPSKYQKEYKGWPDMPRRAWDFVTDVGTPISAAQIGSWAMGKKTLQAAVVPFFGAPTSKLSIQQTNKVYYERLAVIQKKHGRYSDQWKRVKAEFESMGYKFREKAYQAYTER